MSTVTLSPTKLTDIAIPSWSPVLPSTGERPIPITEESLTEALKLAVLQRGENFRYQHLGIKGEGNCVYWHPSVGPACLFGLALHIMGYNVACLSNGSIVDALLRLGANVSELFMQASAHAQSHQDQGLPWGVVLNDFLVKTGRS